MNITDVKWSNSKINRCRGLKYFLDLLSFVLMWFFSILKINSFSTICSYNTSVGMLKKISCPDSAVLKYLHESFLKRINWKKNFHSSYLFLNKQQTNYSRNTELHKCFIMIRYFPSDFSSHPMIIVCLREQYFMCCVHNLCNN